MPNPEVGFASPAARRQGFTRQGGGVATFDASPITRFAGTWANHVSNIWTVNAWSGTQAAIGAVGGAVVEFLTGSEHSQILKCTNFGFNLAPTAVVDGIQFEFGAVITSGTGKYANESNRLYKAGVANGVNQALGGEARRSTIDTDANSFSTSPVTRTGGTSTDLWNDTWTGADINHSGFGCGFAGARSSGFVTFDVDYVKMTVWFH